MQSLRTLVAVNSFIPQNLELSLDLLTLTVRVPPGCFALVAPGDSCKVRPVEDGWSGLSMPLFFVLRKTSAGVDQRVRCGVEV